MRLKNKILIEGDTLSILENVEEYNGFKVGDFVKIDPNASEQTGLNPNKSYEILSFRKFGDSMNAILDSKLYDRTSYSSLPKGVINIKYITPSEINEASAMYGDSDGDYDSDMESRVQAEEYYDKGLQAYSEGDLLKAEKLYNAALKAGAWLGWTEKDLPPYEEMTKSINEAKEKKDPAEKKKAEKTNYGHKDMSDVDMVNPYELRKGIRIEMVDTDDYEKAMDKAVKKLKKDPMHYSNLIANAKETKGKRADISTEIKDKKLNKVSDKLKDKANEMSVSKKDATKKNANDTLNKKEKASGKPKGVKEMTMTPKKAKGMKSMDVPGKEKKASLKESFNLWEAFKKNILR